MPGTAIGKEIEKTKGQWHLIDAQGLVLGRVASKIAQVLLGKHRPNYTRHVDTGDFVVVINADKIRTTGTKKAVKQYKFFSGYPGGLRQMPLGRMMEKNPAYPLKHAVRGMLPKTALGHQMSKKLYVYAGPAHPHGAQKPQPLNLETIR